MFEQAEWIRSPKESNVCPIFYKQFLALNDIEKAEITITALGVYELYVNEKRIGDFIFAPGCTMYEKRLQCQCYDITDCIQENNNISIYLGTGWYRGRISNAWREVHDAPGAVIAEIKIKYADGKEECVCTDTSWLVKDSNILFSDFYDGEIYDATAENKELGNAVYVDLKKNIIIKQQGEIVREQEIIRAKRYIITPKGERVIDFGQNLAGYVCFKVHASKGEKVVISHAETLDSNGNFYTENYRSAKSCLEYTCGDGEQNYKPHFSFFGFRYIRIDAYPGEINIDDICAIAVYSDMERTGFIETGNEKINRLVSNSLWSQKSNFIDIPTDCPQRDERMGWTGDAQVFAKTASYNYNVYRFFDKWLSDMRADQREDGAVADVVPNFFRRKQSNPGWGDAITIIPWQMYLSYGNKKVLEDNFEAMRKWIDYIMRSSGDKYLWTYSEDYKKNGEEFFGDWLGLDAEAGSYKGKSNDELIASAFYAYSVNILVKSGKVLNYDVSEYEKLYKNIKTTFKDRFPEFCTQTEYVLAVCFDLVEDKQRAADNLAEMIRKNDGKLQTGFIGTPYLLHALSNYGHTDIAYDILLSEEYPSWLYSVNKGATTIWEHWDGIKQDGSFWSSDMNSYNHYSYGSVLDWLYSVSGGINPTEERPGYEAVIIEPKPNKRLGHLTVRLDTEHGTIISSWRYDGDVVRYEITTPVDAQIMIDGKIFTVKRGSYIF